MSFLTPFASTCLALGLILSPPAALSQDNAPADTATAVPSATRAPVPEPSSSARALFSRSRDGIVQVRVLLASAGEQSSLGSGFLVRDDGAHGAWVVTNYHVVSSLAIDPQKYRIELRGSNQRVARARLVALDVVHDLAVLRTEPDAGANDTSAPWQVLKLRDAPLVQGSKVYSLGNPLELGFLISEGIYNGSVESRIYEQMLFSGALNSGMSGGPAIDENGQVVGVNVATRRDGEQLSFLVPKRYALDLLQTAWRNDSGVRPEWRTEIARQLLVHQHFVAGKLLDHAAGAGDTVPGGSTRAGFSSQVLSGRAVPTLDGNLTKCWANGMDGERLRYQRDQLNCNLQSALFVRGNLYTGSLSISHTLLRNDRLATPQFLALGEQGHLGWRGASQGSGERTRAECQDDYVQTSSHVYRVAICARAYRKFGGVYDYSVQATQVDDARERLSSRIDLRGFSFDNARSLGRMFLERLQ
jgi:serine protease Do